MKHCCLFLFLFLPACLFSGDSTAVVAAKQKKLSGYRNLFYKLVVLHPRLNSPFEKELLQHYLLGSGETYTVSETDFKRLQKTVPLYVTDAECKLAEANQQGYCVKYVDLHDDDYFGWGVGNLTVIYKANENDLVSFVDFYDFDKKKKGKRKWKNEFVTRVFRLMAPASARSFVVTYNADAYYVHP